MLRSPCSDADRSRDQDDLTTLHYKPAEADMFPSGSDRADAIALRRKNRAGQRAQGGLRHGYALNQSPRSSDRTVLGPVLGGTSGGASGRARPRLAGRSEYDLHAAAGADRVGAIAQSTPRTVENALLFGRSSEPGIYFN